MPAALRKSYGQIGEEEWGLTEGTELLLIRHGETAWNADRRLQGHIDIALNAEGERQAAALGWALKDEGLHAVIASDLQRAKQTAQALLAMRASPLRAGLPLDAGLRERCYGAFEGLRYQEIALRYPLEYAAWQARDVDAVPPSGERQGESFYQFYTRTMHAILRWARQHQGRKIALVAHGGVLECAYRAAMTMPLGTPRDFEIKNASINRFTFHQDKLRLTGWGDVAHLDEFALDEIK